eukprot:3924882-Prorocentrum_lima.AAC.1
MVKLQTQIGVQPSVVCSLVFGMQLVLESPNLVLAELCAHVLQQAVVVVVPYLPVSHFHVSSEVMQG